MEGDNSVYNDNLNKKEIAEKTLRFWSLPEVLIITLKRFGNNGRKNQKMIDFPLENLDLRKYIVGYDKNSYIYDLYGICNHSGGTSGGHYTAFVKNANGKWYHFNDTNCNEINLGALKTPKAYCFFYRKQKK
jgi:ubiquitin C-terminal hydrolase